MKQGHVRDDGRVFVGKKVGGVEDRWLRPDAFHKHKIHAIVGSAKQRSAKRGVEFNISTDYALSIYPKDGRCPVFGTVMEWKCLSGEDTRANGPSLDRVVPDKGYVEGNVVWMSYKANRLKNDATLSELEKITSWLQKLQPKEAEAHGTVKNEE